MNFQPLSKSPSRHDEREQPTGVSVCLLDESIGQHLRGGKHLSRDAQALRDCYASLTPREREVMALVVSGLLR